VAFGLLQPFVAATIVHEVVADRWQIGAVVFHCFVTMFLALAVAMIVLWAVTGPRFHYSDTWQLVVNTATTVVTFLIVFLIQNTQNRDARAIHLKLDEIIRAIRGASNSMINIETLSDQELQALSDQFEKIRTQRSGSAGEHG